VELMRDKVKVLNTQFLFVESYEVITDLKLSQ